ncbi:envelope glycoprotein L [Saimiriine alphaherpesvirus 1]|uniref:Envelope glycoprotein L n=1 Tax=Saimiriine herpesvirus 1 (strain MV-5-4-PSL) TaxID=10353 RepID=E2IUG9_SHV1|nr:envelope glycoprotein L [Saimiriine alphaherpesvirus 1]ADO13827.1 envelope glycoprotein L [Saimiriine alphaherpesvirus 1]
MNALRWSLFVCVVGVVCPHKVLCVDAARSLPESSEALLALETTEGPDPSSPPLLRVNRDSADIATEAPTRRRLPAMGATEYVLRSVVAETPMDVLQTPCMAIPSRGVAWRYTPPEVFDYQKIDGVFLRYHCPGLDTIVWDKSNQRAYWVNPFQFVFGLAADLSFAPYPLTPQETSAREALYSEITKLADRRHSVADHTPVEPGCVNFEYSRTRQCFGHFSAGSAPPTATDEAPGHSRQPTANSTRAPAPIPVEPPTAITGKPKRGRRPKNGRKQRA